MNKEKDLVMIGSDHCGFELKKLIINFLNENNYRVVDGGAYKLDPDDDYPDIIWNVCSNVWDINGTGNRGILICGTGVGVCVTANKHEGIRAVIGSSKEIVKQSVEHIDCNVLCIGANQEDPNLFNIIRTFLEAEFTGEERHVRRLNKIHEIEMLQSLRKGDIIDEKSI